jgi:hypothetical protein
MKAQVTMIGICAALLAGCQEPSTESAIAQAQHDAAENTREARVAMTHDRTAAGSTDPRFSEACVDAVFEGSPRGAHIGMGMRFGHVEERRVREVLGRRQ